MKIKNVCTYQPAKEAKAGQVYKTNGDDVYIKTNNPGQFVNLTMGIISTLIPAEPLTHLPNATLDLYGSEE